MKVRLNESVVYIATGGRQFDFTEPCVLFLHGSGSDNTCWSEQAHWFAHNGYSVLAPDFPSHSLSGGEGLNSIEASADWLLELFDLLRINTTHIVGHSQGFLTALEFTRRYPNRVNCLVGVGSASSIPVNPILIETAEESIEKAVEMMLKWGFGENVHLGTSSVEGAQAIAAARHIMLRAPLSVDLQCCANYIGGQDATAEIDKPCAMILAEQDKMTPVEAGLATATALTATVEIIPDIGHMLPIEAPQGVLASLRRFISQQ